MFKFSYIFFKYRKFYYHINNFIGNTSISLALWKNDIIVLYQIYLFFFIKDINCVNTNNTNHSSLIEFIYCNFLLRKYVVLKKPFPYFPLRAEFAPVYPKNTTRANKDRRLRISQSEPDHTGTNAVKVYFTHLLRSPQTLGD